MYLEKWVQFAFRQVHYSLITNQFTGFIVLPSRHYRTAPVNGFPGPNHEFRAMIVVLAHVFEQAPSVHRMVNPLVHGAVYAPGSSNVTSYFNVAKSVRVRRSTR